MRRRLLLALCTCALAAACSPPSWQKDALNGVAAARRGEHAEAERLIASALETGPDQGMPPENQAELLGWLGWVQASGPDPSRAVETLVRAVEALRDTKGAMNLDTQRAIHRLAQVRANLGDLEAAEAGFRENLELVEATAAMGSPARIVAINDMAFILAKVGKLDEAKQYVDEGFEILERYRPKDDDARGTLTLIAADLMRRRSEHVEAERLYHTAVELYRGDAERRNFLADAYAGLAGVLAASGRAEEADTAYRDALAALGEPAPDTTLMRERIEDDYRAFSKDR